MNNNTPSSIEDDKRYTWLRRRRLDGALNRTPNGFFASMHELMLKIGSLQINTSRITRSMAEACTKNEFKFAIIFENALNTYTSPEYRQLIVECLMILHSLLSQKDFVSDIFIDLDSVLRNAENFFAEEQREHGADEDFLTRGQAGLMTEFLDSAPSGQFGTLTYIAKSIANIFS